MKKKSLSNSSEFEKSVVPATIENSNYANTFGPGPGFGYPSNQGVPWSTQISNVNTIFKNLRWYLISNMRQPISQAYVEIGLIQTITDVPVDDALRGGITITSQQLDEDNIKQLQTSIKRDGDLIKLGQALKWTRLFGGGGIIIVTDQKADEPINIPAININTPLEFIPCDMWELFWSFQNTSQFAQVMDGNPLGQVQTYNYYGQQVDKSRVIPMIGQEAPSFVRPRLRGWGLSVCERLVRSVNQYLKNTDVGFEVMDEFKIDIYRLKGLATTLANPQGRQKVQERIGAMNYFKNFQNGLVLDKEDEYDHKQLSFAGLAEIMDGVRVQVASDMRMPITKLFGTSQSKGFSTDQNDMEVYNSMVESDVRAKAEPAILKMVEIKCQKLFGFIPDDLEIAFQPLRMLTAEQEENVKDKKFTRILQAKAAGEITRFEFRESMNKEKLLPITLDNAGDELNEFDPDIEEKVAGEPDPLATDDTQDEKIEEKGLGQKNPEAKEKLENKIHNAKLADIVRAASLKKNSDEYDRAAFMADGGEGQFIEGRKLIYEDEMMKERGKMQKAIESSMDIFGVYKWQYAVWKFKQLGGRVYGGKSI